MSRASRRLLAAALSIPVLAALAAAAVYRASEWRLRDIAGATAFTGPIPDGPAAIERGRLLAITRGCHGCHGQRLEGHDFGQQWAPMGAHCGRCLRTTLPT